MTSSTQAPPAAAPYTGRFDIPDGFINAYIDANPINFNRTQSSTKEIAYAIHVADKTTKNLSEIIKEGRMVSLKFKNGVPLGVILHPRLQLISNICKFVLYFNNDSQAVVLPEKMLIGRSTDDQYLKISVNMLKA